MNKASLIKSRGGPARGVALPGNICIVCSSTPFPPAWSRTRLPNLGEIEAAQFPPLAWEEQTALQETPCLALGEKEVEEEEEEKMLGVIPGKLEGALSCQSNSWCPDWAALLLRVQEEVMHEAL